MAENGENDALSSDEEGGYQMEEIDLGEEKRGYDVEDRAWKGDLRMDRLPPGCRAPTPAEHDNRNSMPEPVRRKFGRTVNTGPKGVRADYERAKLTMQAKQMRESMRASRTIKKMAQGSVKYVPAPQADKVRKRAGKSTRDSSDSESSEESSCESEDEEFLKYKMQRLQLLRDEVPLFGSFDRAEPLAMMNFIKAVHPLTCVLVHLYQNHIQACTLLNLILEDLAPQFEHVRFLRVRSTDLIKNYKDAGCPTLLVYRGGEQILSFVPLTAHLGTNFRDADVLAFLTKQGLLNFPIKGLPPTKRTR